MFITGTELTAFAAVLRTQGHGPATVVKYHREAAAFAAWLGGEGVDGGAGFGPPGGHPGPRQRGHHPDLHPGDGADLEKKLDKLNLLL